MHEHNLDLFLASLTALAVGPLLHGAARGARALGFALHALFAVVIVALSAVLVLPELVREMGLAAPPVVALGLLTPTVVERALRRARRHGEALSTALAIGALALHAFCDGLAVHSLHSGHGPAHAQALALGAVLHRLPEGAAVWYLVRGRVPAFVAAVFGGMALASALGFVFASRLAAPGPLTACLEAFVAGVVLHVVFHHGPARPARAEVVDAAG